jgi:hypothetical protein
MRSSSAAEGVVTKSEGRNGGGYWAGRVLIQAALTLGDGILGRS